MSHPTSDGEVKELAEIRAGGRELSRDEGTDLYTRHDQYMVE